MTPFPWYFVSTLMFFIFSCGQSTSSGYDKKIVGGQVPLPSDPLLKSIVALRNLDGEIFCTGVLVSDQAIVTAAHCLDEHQIDDFDQAFWNPETEDFSEGLKAVSLDFLAPKLKAQEFPNFDLVVVRLKSKVSDDYTPIAIAHHVEPQSRLQIFGFGKTSTTCAGKAPPCAGSPRTTTMHLAEVIHHSRYHHLLKLKGDGTGACAGDSGGPALIFQNGRHELVGTTSGVWHLFNDAVHQDQSQICESGEVLYTSAVGYRSWILKSATGESPDPIEPTPKLYRRFLDWCLDRDFRHPSWTTTQRILDIVSESEEAKIYQKREVYSSCQLASNIAHSMLESSESLSFPRISSPLYDLAPVNSLSPLGLSFYFNELSHVDFSPLSSVEKLEIVSSSIDQKSFCSILKMNALKSLAISFVKAPIDLACISDHPQLEDLEISYTEITEISHLARFKKLKNLRIYGISDDPQLREKLKIPHIIWEP